VVGTDPDARPRVPGRLSRRRRALIGRHAAHSVQ
jgi:hypothetical protein